MLRIGGEGLTVPVSRFIPAFQCAHQYPDSILGLGAVAVEDLGPDLGGLRVRGK